MRAAPLALPRFSLSGTFVAVLVAAIVGGRSAHAGTSAPAEPVVYVQQGALWILEGKQEGRSEKLVPRQLAPLPAELGVALSVQVDPAARVVLVGSDARWFWSPLRGDDGAIGTIAFRKLACGTGRATLASDGSAVLCGAPSGLRIAAPVAPPGKPLGKPAVAAKPGAAPGKPAMPPVGKPPTPAAAPTARAAPAAPAAPATPATPPAVAPGGAPGAAPSPAAAAAIAGPSAAAPGPATAVVIHLATNKQTLLSTPLTQTFLAGGAADLRVIWSDAKGIWTAPVTAPKLSRQVAPEAPRAGLSVSPSGDRAVGVYRGTAHQRKAVIEQDMLFGFALDGAAARRKAIQHGAALTWSADGRWVLVQDGHAACIMAATGGQYKCWKGYRGVAIARDGRYALLLGNRGDKDKDEKSARNGKDKHDKHDKKSGKGNGKNDEKLAKAKSSGDGKSGKDGKNGKDAKDAKANGSADDAASRVTTVELARLAKAPAAHTSQASGAPGVSHATDIDTLIDTIEAYDAEGDEPDGADGSDGADGGEGNSGGEGGEGGEGEGGDTGAHNDPSSLTGELHLYRAALEGAFTAAPLQLAPTVDGPAAFCGPLR